MFVGCCCLLVVNNKCPTVIHVSALRCWKKWIGPPPLVATAFKQTLQRTVVCSRSDATKLSYWWDGNELLACCMSKALWITGARGEWRQSKLKRKSILFLFNRPKLQTALVIRLQAYSSTIVTWYALLKSLQSLTHRFQQSKIQTCE